MISVVLVLLAVAYGTWWAIRQRGQHRPRPMAIHCERWFLDNPLRHRFFGPQGLLTAIGPLEGLDVAEIGVGVGVVAQALAHAVGPQGTFWGVDIQPGAVRATLGRLEARGLAGRAQVSVADAANLPWDDQSLDWVTMVSVFGEIGFADRAQVLRDIERVLKPGGRLAIMEYWPDPHYQPYARLCAQLQGYGFEVGPRLGNALVYTAVAVPDALPWAPCD